MTGSTSITAVVAEYFGGNRNGLGASISGFLSISKKDVGLAYVAGASVLVASHERERAGALADRVVSVVAGQVSERPVPDRNAGDGPPGDQP